MVLSRLFHGHLTRFQLYPEVCYILGHFHVGQFEWRRRVHCVSQLFYWLLVGRAFAQWLVILSIGNDHYVSYDRLFYLITFQMKITAGIAYCGAVFLLNAAVANSLGTPNRLMHDYPDVKQLTIELCVLNTVDILRLNRPLFLAKSSKGPIQLARLIRDIFFPKNDDDDDDDDTPTCDDQRYSQNRLKFGRQLAGFPLATRPMRTRLFALTCMMEWALCLLQLTLTLFIVILLYYSRSILQSLSLMETWLLLLDMSLLAYFNHYLCRTIFTSVYMLVSVSVLFAAYYRRLNLLLAPSRYLRLRLWYFGQVHGRLGRHIASINQANRKLMLPFLVLNLPVNLYLIAYIYYRPENESLSQLVSLLLIVLLQMVGPFIMMFPICSTSKAAHSSSQSLPRVQLLIGRHLTALKLKQMALYERINSDTKIGFQLAPFGTITRDDLFQSIFVYLAYLMVAARMINSNRSNTPTISMAS